MLFISNVPSTSSGGTGDVVGPAGATDNALTRYDGVTGKIIQNGTVTESDNGDLQAVNSVVFGATPTGTTTQGQMYWDAAEQTVSVNVDQANGVKLSIGTEQYIRIVNKTGVQINDGQVVYISGAQGNRPTATLARADVFSTTRVIGVATQNIADNAEGFVTTYGEVHGYNTTGFTAGDKLYLSAATAGLLTNTVPSSPNYNVSVGVALNSTINGNIFIKPELPIDMDVTLGDNSDLVVASEKAVKTYADTKIASTYLDTDVTLAANSDVKIATQKATKTYVDTMVAGLLDYRGGYNASVNTFPASGGSGTAGAVMKGDMWIVSVAGTLGGAAVQIGDSLIANVDTPGQTAGNWNILNANISYVPEDVANKAITMSGNTASDTKYLSAKAVYDWGVATFAALAGSISQAFAVSQLEVGHATDTTITRSAAGVIAVEGVVVPTISSTNTITGKRNQPRIVSATSYTTDTGTALDFSTCDVFVVTAQAGALKFNNPSGTPVHGEKIIIRVKDNGTARALTYDTQYRAIGVTLPTTTVISKTTYLGGIWNATDTKLDIIAVATEA